MWKLLGLLYACFALQDTIIQTGGPSRIPTTNDRIMFNTSVVSQTGILNKGQSVLVFLRFYSWDGSTVDVAGTI